MFVNSATDRALDLIAARASDVYNAYTPGAMPSHDDVATESPQSRFALDPLSVAAPNDDYFVTSDGRGRTSYTRDGRLTLSNGTIVGTSGRPMLGFTLGNSSPRELTVDPVDVALGRVANLRVEPDGNVAYDRRVVDPRSGETQMQRVSVGRLALARFPASTRLGATDDSSMLAPAGVIAHLGRPGDDHFGTLTPMRREESRIDLNRSLDRLHDAYIAFDALQAAHKAQGHTGQVAMDLLK